MPHVERSLGDFQAIHLGEVRVEHGRVHPVRAGAVDALAVDQHRQVPALIAVEDHVVRDGPFAHEGQAVHSAERLSDVPCAAVADFAGLDAVLHQRAPHVDRFGKRAQREREVHFLDLASRHGHAPGDLRPEAGKVYRDVVVAGREARSAVAAVACRDDNQRPVGRGVRDRHGHARQPGPVGPGHDAHHPARASLGPAAAAGLSAAGPEVAGACHATAGAARTAEERSRRPMSIDPRMGLPPLPEETRRVT